MRKTVLFLLITFNFSFSSYAGLSAGLPGAVKKQVAKLDEKVLSAAKTKNTPASFSGQAGNGAAEITWASVPGASSYNLYWGDTPQLQAIRPLNKTTRVTSPYILTGLANGAIYYYSISSVSDGIESNLTPVAQITPSALLPLRPEGVSGVNGTGQITLNWDSVSGASSYNIYWGSAAGVTKVSTKISGATMPYAHTALTYGQIYYYRVSAQNAAGESILSTEAAGTPLLALPQNVAVSTGNAQNTVSWNAVSGATAYNIYWGASAGITKASTRISGVASPYAHTGLTNGQTYYYRVTAMTSKEESGLSAEVSAITVPDAPRNAVVTASDGQNTVSWDAVTGAVSYNIYWGVAAGITKASAKFSGAVSPCEHTGLTNGQAYYYRITAVNAAGESALSAEVSGTPIIITIPDAPQNAAVASSNVQNTVSWDAVAEAVSYNIYWGVSAGITTASTRISGVASPYAHTGLTNGHAYYYRVSAQNASGESALSEEVTGTPAITSGDKLWARQFGSVSTDDGYGVATDSSSNVYVTGRTAGGLDGNTNEGDYDMFLAKYDASGARLWTKQLGTSSYDEGRGVAADSSGNVYVTGRTYGGLDGNTNEGDYDMFLVQYSASGIKQWTRQLGTSSYDEGRGVATDSSGNVYVAGDTNGGLDGNTNAGGGDMFLVKYDSSGNKKWTKELGTPSSDFGSGVTTDFSGNIYVTGYTDGVLGGAANAGGYDIFVVKYSTSGAKLWTRQLGTNGSDFGSGVATDSSGNVYVTGRTNGGLDGNTNEGDYDMFLVKYSTAGVKRWTRQLGTSLYDEGRGVAIDSSDNVYVSGYTAGGLDGNTNAGGYDMFLVKYDSSGAKLWTKQFGTASSDLNSGVAADSSGNVYVTGSTEGGLDGNTNQGGSDMFLVKYAQ
ncbi:MAG: SBBP repeat-containing protein [Elusimicrobia bacterium]|nr:SBBP repeat-containing protein [Elusimicrobiota bacterium]